MHRRLTYTALVLASSAAVLVAGCGGSSSGTGSSGQPATTSNDSGQPPPAELTSAVKSLGSSRTFSAVLKLGGDADAVKSFAAATGHTITDTQASALAGVQVAIDEQAESGKTISQTPGSSGATNIAISNNGITYVSIRMINGSLYLEVDLKDLLPAIGESSALSELTTIESTPTVPPFLKALVDDEWVSLPITSLDSMAGNSVPSASPQQAQKVITGFESILTKDVTVSRTTNASTDTLKLQANSRQVLADVLSTISSAVPSSTSALNAINTSQIPSKNVTFGATVTGGSLSRLSIDLGQFVPASAQPVSLPLDIDLSKSGPAVTAPSGAVAANTQLLGALFGSLGAGLGS